MPPPTPPDVDNSNGTVPHMSTGPTQLAMLIR